MRPYNFSAGPATMPESVLQQAAAEMLDWRGTGMSVMEMSHRSAAFEEIAHTAEQNLRQLLVVPDNFSIVFMQGGGLGQNAIVPLNLLGHSAAQGIDIVVSGAWSEKSAQEAQKYGTVHIAADNRAATTLAGQPYAAQTYLPPVTSWRVRPEATYLHLCSNETIHGIEYVDFANIAQHHGTVPLVVDASSHIASRPIDFSAIGVLYAGAQKNLGPAGVTVVIVRNDLLNQALPICPTASEYQQLVRHRSLYNTPPTYAIYMMGLVFEWLRAQGGVIAIEQRNQEKAEYLYQAIDRSDFYTNSVQPDVRSRMNIPFFLAQPQLEATFLEQAQARGLWQLKGHKSVGGLRASLYNAMPREGVHALVDFLQEFEKQYG